MRPYPWLVDYLNARLPELEGLRDTPKGLEKARSWFKALLKYFRRRQLKTPRQQKNYVVDVRNAIRSRFGEDHPALKVVGFDEDTWTQINKPIHDRVEDRNQNTRFLKDPDAIVQRAETLLSSKTSTWADLAVGLGVATGRRISELLGYRTKLEQKTNYSVLFTGQLKSRGDLFTFEIPTLCSAQKVLEAWKSLRFMLGSEQLDPQIINLRYGRQCKEAANKHFADLVPPRHGDDDLYMHLFRAIYATIAVFYFCPPRVNDTLFKAEIQGHRMIIDTADKKKRRAYSASRHYDDYKIQDASGNVDGRRGLRLGKPGVQVLEVFQTPGISAPPTEPVSTARTETIPMPPAHTTKPAKKPAKPAKQIKPHNWRISDAAHKILAKDWTLAKDEHQSDVFERVLAFANAAKGLASTMELPVGQIAPETLLDTFTTKFHTLSENLKKASAQVDKLKFDHHQLSAERDALTARVAALQTQIQDASIRQAPPVELLPFARRVLELSSKSGSLPPAELRDSLMRLAIDAITQAEGSPAAAPATESPIHTTPLEPATASVATALPRPPQQTVSAPAPASVTPVDQKHDGDGSEPPVATQNRNTAKAEAKLEKALEYLININDHTDSRSEKWVINDSILFSLTGCFRPAIRKFMTPRQAQIDELNLKHGLGPGHNRAKSRTQPNAFPAMVKTFKESVLKETTAEQPF